MHQAWQEESLATPPGERLTHWVRATKQAVQGVWAVKMICRASIDGGMKTTRTLPWRGPEEVNCLFCITHPDFVWAQ